MQEFLHNVCKYPGGGQWPARAPVCLCRPLDRFRVTGAGTVSNTAII